VTPAELAGWVERSRREQNYPPHVEDVGVLAAVATLADDDDRAERGDGGQAA
jgi:hypothetical protein